MSATKKPSSMIDKLHKQESYDKIFRLSEKLGFDLIGIAPISLEEKSMTKAQEDLQAYLERHYHGTMGWMEREQRHHPLKLWDQAKSAIMLGASYCPDGDVLAPLEQKNLGVISVYAMGEDYHKLLGKKIKTLGQTISRDFNCQVKSFIDTVPIMEKPLAALAGIGWQGKHTNLVSRKLGSWFFLAGLLTDLALLDDRQEPHQDHCGSCRNCLDICPTNAFPKPYQLDARRCISYLTIEHKGHIPRAFRSAIGNHIYGCDDCLAVCPWNKFAQKAQSLKAFKPHPDLQAPMLRELASLNEASFHKRFKNSPIKRIGRKRFIRNVLIAIGNSEDKSNLDCVRLALSDQEPLIRAAAIWAFGQLANHHDFLSHKALYGSQETDPALQAEWDQSA